MPFYALTGANRGLGLEFVRQISEDKSNTVVAAVRSKSNDLKDLNALNKHNNIHILECDTGSISSINAFAESFAKTFAGKKIDFLLNNSAINANPELTSLTLDQQALDEHMRINLLGPAKTTEALLKADTLSSDVRILNMTSGLGSSGVHLTITPRKCATYAISKGAVNMLSVLQSEDLKEKLPGVVVISMDPGWVKTRMGGEGAQLEPHESISGMLKTLRSVGQKDSGKAFTYSGSEMPF